MKDHEFLRIIEEASETHSYKMEIVIVACIYLACKINEEMKRIRDILNMTYIVTAFYKKRNKELAEIDPETYANKISYVSLDYLKEESKKTKEGEEAVEKGASDWFFIENVPSYSLEKYNSLRDDVLRGEQHLLRILNYDLENKYQNYYQLLFKVCKTQKLPHEIVEKALAVYNDSFFVTKLNDFKEDWRVLLSIFMAFQLVNPHKNKQVDVSDFEKKTIDKLQREKPYHEASEKFMSFMLDYYNDLKDEPSK